MQYAAIGQGWLDRHLRQTMPANTAVCILVPSKYAT